MYTSGEKKQTSGKGHRMMEDRMAGELELVEQYLRQFTEDLRQREPLNEILKDVLGAPGKRLQRAFMSI